jgi:hypothetical protein
MGLSLFLGGQGVPVSHLFAHGQSVAGLTLSGGVPTHPTVQKMSKSRRRRNKSGIYGVESVPARAFYRQELTE